MYQISPSKNVTFLIYHHLSLKPTCMRLRANEDKQRVCWKSLFFMCVVIDDRNLFEMTFSMYGNDTCTGFDLDIGCVRNLINEIFGHVLRKRIGTHQHYHFMGIFCKVDSSLSSRVPATHHVDILINAKHRFGDRGTVIDPLASQSTNTGYIQLAVRNTIGE